MDHSATHSDSAAMLETPNDPEAETADSPDRAPNTTFPAVPGGAELPEAVEAGHRWHDRLLGWLGMSGFGSRAPLSVLKAQLEEQLRNAEAELEHKRRSLAQLEAQGHELMTERRSLEQEHSRLDRDVELALAESQDKLARFALCRTLALRQKLERVDNKLRSTTYASEQLAELVTRQQAEFASLRLDAELALGARERAHSQQPLDPISEEEVELELLRRKRRIAQRDSEQKEVTDASSEL